MTIASVKYVIEEYSEWVEIESSNSDVAADQALLQRAAQAFLALAEVRQALQATGVVLTSEGAWTQPLLPEMPSRSDEPATKLRLSSRSYATGHRKKRTRTHKSS